MNQKEHEYNKKYYVAHIEEARAKSRDWYWKNKERAKQNNLKWRKTSKDKYLSYKKKYAAEHREQRNLRDKKFRLEHRDEYRSRRRETRARHRDHVNKHYSEYMKKRRYKERQMVYDHYGHSCACCGETTYEFLTIDHINGGGFKHRKEIGSSGICNWLIKNNFPEGFQVLCYNCNCAKGFYGQCPHKYS